MQVVAIKDKKSKFKEELLNKKIKCLKGNQAIKICANKGCTTNAFICEQDGCDCRMPHKLCMQLNIIKVIQSLDSKCFSLEPVFTMINELFQHSIDALSQMKDKILKQFKIKYQFQGLQQNQLQFIKAIRQQNVQDISCNYMWNMILKIHDKKQKVKSISQIQKNIKELWDNFDYQVKQFQKSMLKYSSNIYFDDRVYVKGSNIVKNFKEQTKLINFFPSKIKSINLLYRASDQNFELRKFHEKCDNNSHTLTICKTQFDYIVGGYTIMKWNYDEIGHYNHPQQKTFLFSLTNNQKLPLMQNKQYEIYCNPSFGPTFGKGYDLFICDKANQKRECSTRIGITYNNGNYNSQTQQSHKKFTGGSKFMLKQWEVWTIQFSY